MKVHNVLVVCDLGQLHGVGTLSTRMSRLNSLEHCNIVYYSLGEPTEFSLHYIRQNGAKLIKASASAQNAVAKIINSIKNFFFLARLKRDLLPFYDNYPQPDIIFSVSSETLALSFMIQEVFPQTQLVTGLFHSSEYSWKPIRENLFSIFTKKIIKCLPSSNIFAMNQSVIDSHQSLISDAVVIPLFIDLERFNLPRYPKKNKIVSVGQIIPFKTYNFYMLDVISELRGLKCFYEYHIYGHGSQVSELIERIKVLKLSDSVFFHGKLDYEDFPAILADAYVFIGMGTSIIEASASGTPSILASPTVEPLSYGWYFEQNGYECGENLEVAPSYKVVRMLEELDKIDDASYTVLCEKSKLKANSFSFNHVSELFINGFENAQANRKIKLRFWLILVKLESLALTLFKFKNPNRNRRDIVK